MVNVQMPTEKKRGHFGEEFTLLTDGLTLWVNHENECIARFSYLGADIRPRRGLNILNFGEAKKRPDLEQWRAFVAFIHDCYGFRISDETWRPTWIQDRAFAKEVTPDRAVPEM